MKNKKAVSAMVAYTLLIIIAIALSVFVYNYLKVYVPGDRPKCQPDINLAVENITCDLTTKKLNLILSNRGLFNISGAYIRVGLANKTVRSQVNNGSGFFPKPFSPEPRMLGMEFDLAPDLPITTGGNNVLEVQPLMLIKNRAVPCENAVVSYPLTCS